MSVIVYGFRGRSVNSAWGAVPATAAMPVTVRVDGSNNVSGVLWSIDGKVIAESNSPDARLALTGIPGSRSLAARCQLGGGGIVTVAIPIRLRPATAAEESAFAGTPTPPPGSPDVAPPPTTPPPPRPTPPPGGSLAYEPTPFPEEAGKGCQVPRSSLRVISRTEAATMTVIDRCLVLGRLETNAEGLTITNSIIEANFNVTGGSGPTSALLYRTPGYRGVTAKNVTVTGMSRDDQGNPVRIYPVNRGIAGGFIKFEDGIVEYINDGVDLASNTTLLNGVVARHTSIVVAGDSQHPDGSQGQQGGYITVDGMYYDGTVNPSPLLPNGEKVPGSPMRGAAGVMLNHARQWTGPVIVRNCIFDTTASVGLNIAGGIKPVYGDAYPDGLEWTTKRYDAEGNMIQGILVENCEWRGTHKDFMIRARKELLRENFPAWGGSRSGSAGDSSWGRYRNADGTYRDLPPGAIYGTG